MSGDGRHLTFRSFPVEIRKRIYRLLLVHSGPLKKGLWSPEHWQLSAQLLRTSRQIYDEAKPVLYGENTFQINISNKAGPGYNTTSYPRVLVDVFNEEDVAMRSAYDIPEPSPLLQLMTRFKIKFEYTSCYNPRDLRDDVRWLVALLQLVPRIAFLKLKCDLDCEDTSDRTYTDPAYDNYEWDRYTERDVGPMLRTWLGRLRNVETAVVEGLPVDIAVTIKNRWEGDEPLASLPLPDMYRLLERHAMGIIYEPHGNKDRLLTALQACESDNMKLFNEYQTAIRKSMRRHLEVLDNAMARQDNEEDVIAGGDNNSKEGKNSERGKNTNGPMTRGRTETPKPGAANAICGSMLSSWVNSIGSL